MTIEETPRQIIQATAAGAAPLASYLSGASAVVTLLAGIASLVWIVSSLWKLYFPASFERFVKRINEDENHHDA